MLMEDLIRELIVIYIESQIYFIIFQGIPYVNSLMFIDFILSFLSSKYNYLILSLQIKFC